MAEKQCSKCGETKPDDAFNRDNRRPNGRRSRCRRCQSVDERKQYNADTRRTYRLQHLYAITDAEYTGLLDKQGGVCCICRLPETKKTRGQPVALAVDHCHETGQQRGLLCHRCNLMLGYAQDDPIRLMNGIQYLQTHMSAAVDAVVH